MSARATLLIELGCEELPARLLGEQARMLHAGVARQLAEAGLVVDGEAGRGLATPRRLALEIPQVADRQPDRTLERKGPAESSAFDADGNPTRAAEGFARSVGLDVDQLGRVENEQGRWLFAEVEQPGQSLGEILPGILEQTVREMAGARSMRWSDRAERFLRPVRWLVALHGEDVVPLELFGLNSDRRTRGHRVHAPGDHELSSATDYEKVLDEAWVMADPARRRARIGKEVARLADEAGLEARPDPDLIDEVSGLTEWPVAVLGRFDPDFLDVPAEALIASMQQHQKCFPLFGADGELAARFIAIANIESTDPEAMTAGFERVIRPRLADARFFWDADRRQSLDQRLDRLDEILFADRLGSLGDKRRRLETLAGELAPDLGGDAATAARAARLCKADLVTEMVGEFPELQGTMGRHYALAAGEDKTVALAIESHYRPRQAGDGLPTDPAGQALALADRLDTLVGAFAAGHKPRGGKDPFALRRAALGVVRILEATGLGRSVPELLKLSADRLTDTIEVTPDALGELELFILDRLRSHAGECGIEVNTVHAVAAGAPAPVADFMARARAVQAFADDPDAVSLIAANKRTQNLLRQAGAGDFGDVDEKSLQNEAESRLLTAIQQAESDLERHLEQTDYPAALTRLAQLKDPVDLFFDEVMVMADDPDLQRNRLALLARLRALFLRVADVARLGRGG